MENNYKDAAEAAANWWAEKMQLPLNQDNGTQNEPEGGMMFMLMLMNMVGKNAQSSLSEQKIINFKINLMNYLIDEPNDSYHKWSLGVDYHPDEPLADAAEKSGIDVGCMPCKSHMRIDRKTFVVTASFKYHGECKQIYPAVITTPATCDAPDAS